MLLRVSTIHGNRQSFAVYSGSNGGVKATSDRDYISLLRHSGLASAQVMLQAYRLYCKLIGREPSMAKRIEMLMEAVAGEVVVV